MRAEGVVLKDSMSVPCLGRNSSLLTKYQKILGMGGGESGENATEICISVLSIFSL